MATLDKRWTRIDAECYRLNDEYCFPGTLVFVDLVGYKRWMIRLVNIDRYNSPSPDVQVENWSVRSKRAWRSDSTTRQKALGVRFEASWLLKIGIDVNDPKYADTRLVP